jgi:predicted AAA+ superfamily ATPase
MTSKREISNTLKELLKNHTVLIIIGPKGSGKTKLVKELFEKFDYYSFDKKASESTLSKNMITRQLCNNKNIILDEVPAEFNIAAILKKLIKEGKLKNKVIIISSTEDENLSELVKKFPLIARKTELLPLSHSEINRIYKEELSIDIATFYGGISGVYENVDYMREYFSDYISQIFKKTINGRILSRDNDKIILLLKYLAENVGEILNFNPLATVLNTNYRKFIPLLSLLVKSRLVFLLPAYVENFGRRVISFPRVYFYDTALASYLNDIRSPYQLSSDKMRDALVKNLMILEIMKSFFNKGIKPDFYFWKEVLRTDIDCIIDLNGAILPIVIKNDSAPYNKIIGESRVFAKLSGAGPEESCIIYMGKKSLSFRGYNLISHKEISKLPDYFSFTSRP